MVETECRTTWISANDYCRVCTLHSGEFGQDLMPLCVLLRLALADESFARAEQMSFATFEVV
jgi:hypothetical protein